MQPITNVWKKLRTRLAELDWLGPLGARASLGALFFGTGLGKWQHLDRVVAYFTELGIPAPGLQAPFVALLELVGGLALIVGAGTRPFSLLLLGTMVVAVFTARLGDVDGIRSFFALEEVTYAVVLVWLVLSGPGRASIDAFLGRKLGLDAIPRTREKPATLEASTVP